MPAVTTRSAPNADGAGGRPLPAPNLDDVWGEDLEDTGRLLALLARAIGRGLVGASEADRLRFVASAEHARRLGKGNPPGLFMYLVRNRLWRYLTQEDDDGANARIKRELRGEPSPRPGDGGERGSAKLPALAFPRRALGGAGPGMSWGAPKLSEDALVVREVRGAIIRAGVFRDPFPEFRRLEAGWDRARRDAALAELGLSRDGPRDAPG